MEDWSKEFFAAVESTVESTVAEIDKFFQVAGEEFQGVVDELAEASEEITQEIRDHWIPELEVYFAEIMEPILDVYLDLEFDLADDEFEPFVTYSPASRTKHPACRGCQHYHGQIYGGNLLVCAMHPHGVEGESCPDWESN
ncbi:MAG: hypothetical protein ACFBSC_10140 [Microcoleaceae cyanobacterium]